MSATCIVAGSVTEPGGCVTVPTVPPNTSSLIPSHLVPVAHHVASLPFTGADVMELLAVGVAAVLAGTLLKFRKRNIA
jgi:hypothetical protein